MGTKLCANVFCLGLHFFWYKNRLLWVGSKAPLAGALMLVWVCPYLRDEPNFYPLFPLRCIVSVFDRAVRPWPLQEDLRLKTSPLVL